MAGCKQEEITQRPLGAMQPVNEENVEVSRQKIQGRTATRVLHNTNQKVGRNSLFCYSFLSERLVNPVRGLFSILDSGSVFLNERDAEISGFLCHKHIELSQLC